MKSILLKTFLVVNLFFIYNCKAQTANDYITFYSNVVPKLNLLVPNKTQYYGQSLLAFLQALNQNNIIVKEYEPAPFNNKLLKLSFTWNRDLRIGRYDHNYVEPYISIYFQQPFNYPQATVIFNNNYHSYWNPAAENFYKNLIIEKIEFWYVRGLTDNSMNPK
ncbi:hypothetical protein [Chryseobacterium wangxinyae]|uniref:hypothetical protein n=1 Tax=Chryseobacterium sp. CY353 TaxID=2997334 RepID=UPI002271A56F|nr:hypothetical protein [Chryseobacterium sp. CY353]MCY0969532.1 hypothetical protein [Chryseobacterium sp. CY353]